MEGVVSGEWEMVGVGGSGGGELLVGEEERKGVRGNVLFTAHHPDVRHSGALLWALLL